jgi:hypothetical protein
VDQMADHSQHHPGSNPGEATDPPGPHGMAVIGERAVYFSHLPMFMSPHDYQVILEVELEGSGNPQEVYFRDRKDHPETLLRTFDPVLFVLPNLFPTAERPPKATSFQGDLYRGHFERKDTKPVRLASDVTVQVKNVIHHHKFDPNAKELAQLQYVLFGTRSELLLAHFIVRPSTFDQLMSVEVDVQIPDEALRQGIVVKLPDRPNTIAARIRPGADSELPAVVEAHGQAAQQVTIRPTIEHYLELGDLQ